MTGFHIRGEYPTDTQKEDQLKTKGEDSHTSHGERPLKKASHPPFDLGLLGSRTGKKGLFF